MHLAGTCYMQNICGLTGLAVHDILLQQSHGLLKYADRHVPLSHIIYTSFPAASNCMHMPHSTGIVADCSCTWAVAKIAHKNALRWSTIACALDPATYAQILEGRVLSNHQLKHMLYVTRGAGCVA